jgi:ketosteroid isomerase-like protein
MHHRLLCAVFSLVVFSAGPPNSWAQSADEQAVTGLVERFLTTIGNADLEALPAMFAANANVGTPAQIDGKRTMSCTAFDAWISARIAAGNRNHFREPVNEFTVHVDGDLAFVRADANYIVDDEVRSNNIDYFTLIRVDGAWKFVNASFVAKAPKQK